MRGSHPGALFDSPKCLGRAMSAEWVAELVQKRGRAAGITRKFTSHDFRRTVATRALRQDVDVFTVQRLLGHKNVQTTVCYDRRTEMEDRAVIDLLDLPGLNQREKGGAQ